MSFPRLDIVVATCVGNEDVLVAILPSLCKRCCAIEQMFRDGCSGRPGKGAWEANCMSLLVPTTKSHSESVPLHVNGPPQEPACRPVRMVKPKLLGSVEPLPLQPAR